jgi:1-aminocyclopropane-1-carboxylate deaminase
MPTLQQQFNTPFLQQLFDDSFEKQLLEVLVLRMDNIHPIISGNKAMKLLPWLSQAIREGKKGIVTRGGPWSNHVHAAAFAAQLEGLTFIAIIKAKKGMVTPMLEDVLKWGGTIEYIEKESELDETDCETFAAANDSLFIPLGGEGPVATEGVRAFIDELKLPSADYVICPVGTGTTLKGIAKSNLRFDTLIGINPGINNPNYDLMMHSLQQRFPLKECLLIKNKSLKKFGKWPAFLPGKMNEWYRRWQLPTDVIYTAKMLFVFEELVRNNFFKHGSKILLIHTGGLQGNRSLPEELLEFR